MTFLFRMVSSEAEDEMAKMLWSNVPNPSSATRVADASALAAAKHWHVEEKAADHRR